MMFFRWLILAFAVAHARGKPVQLTGLQLPPSAAAHQQAVVDLFTQSYEAYQKYAWGHDDLLPMSKSYGDSRNGWGASIADALGTMWLMGFYTQFDKAVDHIAKVDFSLSKTDSTVSLFETTIRYLGGFLSAYELSGRRYNTLLEKAEELGQQMTRAWVGGDALPYNDINFTTGTPVYATASTSISGAGTLTMEWNRLSLYTRNNTYRQLAEKAVQHMINMPTPLTGMPAMFVDPGSGNPVGAYVTWGGGSDSFYEYLIKYARLTNTDDDSYADAWSTAVDTSIKELLKTSTVGNWTYLADSDDSGKIRHVGSHLACFAGGNWILGGKLLNNDTIVKYGLELTDACWNTYASTATRIGPERFAYASTGGNYTGGSLPTAKQIKYYNEHGYYITASDYILRPEVLESNFYAWRVTGDTKYLDNAASAIQSFREYLRATVAYAGLNDVNNKSSSKIDDTESFWFAEVLKYLYLTFDDPDNISLDKYVFNTECHPFEVPDAKPVYGSGPGPHSIPTLPFITQALTGPAPAISPSNSLAVPLIQALNL